MFPGNASISSGSFSASIPIFSAIAGASSDGSSRGHVVDCCAGFLESRVFQVGFRAEHGCHGSVFCVPLLCDFDQLIQNMLGRLLSGSEEGQKDRAVFGEIVQSMRLSIQILQRDLRQFDVL